MRILITNDDGIQAEGLAILHDIACALTDAQNVFTVAPALEQSGVGHCISYTKPMLTHEMGERRVAVDGSPADCVLVGLWDVMRDAPPDLILSGVNRGNNAAENTLYSGTVGAVIEGALQGIKSIALSQYYGPRNRDLGDTFSAARAFGAETVDRLLRADQWGGDGYMTFYNVNYPPCPADDVLGHRATVQGLRPGVRFGVEATQAPNFRRYLWVRGGPQDVPASAGSDAQANLDDYISVTPMRADLTDHGAVDPLRKVLEA